MWFVFPQRSDWKLADFEHLGERGYVGADMNCNGLAPELRADPHTPVLATADGYRVGALLLEWRHGDLLSHETRDLAGVLTKATPSTRPTAQSLLDANASWLRM
jgi:hypothetical protein